MKKSLFKIGIYFIFCSYVLFSCSKKDSEKINIGYLPYSSGLSFFVAYEKDYFSDEGIIVEPVKCASSNEAMDALRAGEVDFVMGVGLSTFFAIQGAAPGLFKCFQPCVEDTTNYVSYLLTPKQSTLTDVTQLKGKKVGTYSGTSQVLVLELLLKELGYDPKRDVQMGDVSSNIQIDALAAGQFDAFLMLEPYATKAMVLHGAKPLVKSPRVKYILNPFPAGSNAVADGFLNKHPDLTRKVVGVINKAIDFINENEDEAKKILPKYDPTLTEEIAAKTGIYRWWKTDQTDIQAVQKYADLLYEGKILKKEVKVKPMFLDISQ